MATGADWMSAASFIGMAGSLYFGGYSGLAFVLGWTGGYVLVSILMAPYLRKFGQFTVPDFFSARYGGNVARALAVVVLITASFVYVVAQIVGVGIITARFLNIGFEVACFVGLLGILLCSMLGGMKAVTWTQVAQYIILIIAYLIPVTVLSSELTGVPLPQIMYGQALEKIAALEKTLGVLQPHTAAFVDARGNYSPTAMWNFFALILCLMVGTASLPHILMRYFTTPSVKQARDSVAWSLFFIFLLYFTAPAYAAFAKLEVYQSVIGQPIAKLPAWVASWGSIGLVGACDAANAAAQYALCKGVTGNGDGILQLNEFRLHTDAVVLATPEIAGLPYVISGLVAAGGLAAALSTADGLLLAIANALSHDVYYKMIDPTADTKRRLIISRVLLGLVAIVAAYVAGTLGADILFLGVVGLLHRRRRPVRGPGARHLVEARRRCRRHLGDHRGLRPVHVLPDRDRVLRSVGQGKHELAGRHQHREDSRSRRCLHLGHQQHLGGHLRHPGGVPRHDSRRMDQQAGIGGDAGLHRFDPRAGRIGAQRRSGTLIAATT